MNFSKINGTNFQKIFQIFSKKCKKTFQKSVNLDDKNQSKGKMKFSGFYRSCGMKFTNLSDQGHTCENLLRSDIIDFRDVARLSSQLHIYTHIYIYN